MGVWPSSAIFGPAVCREQTPEFHQKVRKTAGGGLAAQQPRTGPTSKFIATPTLAVVPLLDLQAIVVDGNLPRNLIEWLVERLRVLLAAAAPEARQPPTLRLGTTGRSAAVIGAAILPLHSNYGPDQEILFGQ